MNELLKRLRDKRLWWIGNAAPGSIENCQKIEYNPDQIIPSAKVSIGIDPSFGSSKFGIVATRFVNERIEVIEAEEFERPDFNEMINRVWEIKQQHKIDDNNLTIYCDAANPEIWSSLKKMFKEPHLEQYVFSKLSEYKKNNINPRFDKVLTALRTAAANEYKLDKEQTSYHDILDALRLSLQLYQRSNK